MNKLLDENGNVISEGDMVSLDGNMTADNLNVPLGLKHQLDTWLEIGNG